MSVSDLCGDTLNSDPQMHIDKDDPDVQAAAEALGSMARGLPNGSSGISFIHNTFSYALCKRLSCKNCKQSSLIR